MFRHRAFAAMALLASFVAVALGACGGSSQTPSANGSAPTASPTGGGGASQSASGASPAVTVSTCSLLTTSQVTALLGSAPMGSGTEHVYGGNYKGCTWYSGTNSQMNVLVAVNICDCSENQGFSRNYIFGTPMAYPGVGDKATLATNGSAGMFAAAFNAVKGRVAIDLTFQGPVDPSSVKDAMAADVKQILPQFS